MFSSSKVSQSMIDAVNKVLGKEEPKPVVVETPNGRVPFAPAQSVESQTLSESGHEKVATPTGTKVYGSSYGNSKKARQDQTKHSVDDVKEPSKKDIEKDSTLYKKPDSAQKLYSKSSTQSYFSGDYNRNVKKQKPNFEETKPNFLDMDKDGNKKESMKKAIADKGMKEELKSETFEFHLTEGSYADLHKKWGDTHNIEYHSHTLYPKHTVTKFDNEKDAESHAKKTGGTVRMNVSPKMKNEELKGNQSKIDANHNGKIDGQDFDILRGKKKVKESKSFAARLIETVRKSDVPAYLRKAKGDTPLTVADAKGPKKDTISAPENLAKNRNEEVEQIEERDEGKHNNGKTTGFNVVAAKAAKEYGSKEAGARVAGAIRKKVLAKEESELHEDNLDSIAKKHGMKLNKTTYGAGMTHPTKGEVSVNRYGEWNHYPAGSKSSKAHGDSTDKFSSLDKHLSTLKEGKFNQMDVDRQDREAALEKDGWKKMPANVKDKGGNTHTPMSRARDLARASFNKIKSDAK